MNKKEITEITVGMRASVAQLDYVVGKYIILLYDSIDDEEGTVVFVGNEQTDDYNNWFFSKQTNYGNFSSCVGIKRECGV